MRREVHGARGGGRWQVQRPGLLWRMSLFFYNRNFYDHYPRHCFGHRPATAHRPQCTKQLDGGCTRVVANILSVEPWAAVYLEVPLGDGPPFIWKFH